MIASWRSSALRMAFGDASHRRVDPSMSVNKKVTVPVGAPTLTAFHARTNVSQNVQRDQARPPPRGAAPGAATGASTACWPVRRASYNVVLRAPWDGHQGDQAGRRLGDVGRVRGEYWPR